MGVDSPTGLQATASCADSGTNRRLAAQEAQIKTYKQSEITSGRSLNGRECELYPSASGCFLTKRTSTDERTDLLLEAPKIPLGVCHTHSLIAGCILLQIRKRFHFISVILVKASVRQKTSPLFQHIWRHDLTRNCLFAETTRIQHPISCL